MWEQSFWKSAATVAGALLLLLVSRTEAQSTFGVIRGRVVDPSEASVPRAQVTITRKETGAERQQSTNEEGLFEFGYLHPGRYALRVETAGFRTFTTPEISLSANAIVGVRAKLEMGQTTESISVSEPFIQNDSGGLGVAQDQKQYLETPINSRGLTDSYIFNYLSTVPGASPSGTQFNFEFLGSRTGQNNFTVDGISINSPTFGDVVGPATPSLESIQEVKVDYSGNSAEFGHPAQVTVVSRGGGNELHGTGFWYYGSAGLNARNFFANEKGFYVLQNAGGTVSGPVLKNRTFFVGTFEKFIYTDSANVNASVPSEALRAGDFSQVRNTAGQAVTISDPFSGTPVAGSRIPQALLNATALRVQNRFFPRPNFGDAGLLAGNYRELVKQRQERRSVDARVDQHFGSRNLFYARMSSGMMPDRRLDGLPTIGFRNQVRKTWNAVISDTHIVSGNLINEFRAGLTRQDLPTRGPLNGREIVRELGLTGFSGELPNVNAVPRFNITGFSQIRQSDFNNSTDQIVQWQDTVSWSVGSHTVKGGVDVWQNFSANYPTAPSDSFGEVSFTGAYSGHAYSDFLYGLPRQARRALAGVSRNKRRNVQWNVFVTDDWKWSPRLTLSYGLRYTVDPPYNEEADRIYNFNPFTGSLVLPNQKAINQIRPDVLANSPIPLITAAEAGLPERRLGYVDRNNWAPRFGFAFRPLNGLNSTVRGSYGIFYDQFSAQLWNAFARGYFTGTEQSPINTIAGGTAAWRLPAIFPASGFAGTGVATTIIGGFDPHLRNPYMQQWNFTLEHRALSSVFRASYVGMKTDQMVYYTDRNQPVPSVVPFRAERKAFPQLGRTYYRENGGIARYHGLVLFAERRLKQGLMLQTGYTWQKNLTDNHAGLDDGQRPQDTYNRRAEYGQYFSSRAHRFVATVQYTTPRKATLPSWLRVASGGWTISTFALLQTGPWFTLRAPGDPANVGIDGTRPDRIGSGVLANPTIERWFDPNAFLIPPKNAGRFGNAGVNFLAGPGTQVVNAGIFRRFAVRERVSLGLEATFSNVLNHTNFGVPATNLGAPGSVARITETQNLDSGGPRNARLAIRLEF